MSQKENLPGRRSKKSQPQKKAPRRGLGVAQLEKIISEGNQSKELIPPDAGGGLIGTCREIGPMRSQPLFHRPPPHLVRNNQMELPSVQSFQFKNYYPSPLTEEEKMMIGSKRPHSSLSLQSPQSSSLQSKSDEQYTPPRKRKFIRESVSNSSPTNGERLSGDFLSLAPPVVDYHNRHELLGERSFNFFPAKLQSHGEKEETINLDLKL